MNRLLAVSVLIGTTILTLLGGLALVARSLRNVDLTLFLELKKDDTREKSINFNTDARRKLL